MRPTGVVLISIFHFLSALFLVLFAAMLVVGGSIVGGMFGRGWMGPGSGVAVGFLVGALGAVFFIALAIVAAVAGYGVWNMREWGRILTMILAVISLLFSFPGLLMMGLHLHLFFGTYRLFRIAISILILWYLMQPQIRVLFQRTTPAAPAIPQ